MPLAMPEMELVPRRVPQYLPYQAVPMVLTHAQIRLVKSYNKLARALNMVKSAEVLVDRFQVPNLGGVLLLEMRTLKYARKRVVDNLCEVICAGASPRMPPIDLNRAVSRFLGVPYLVRSASDRLEGMALLKEKEATEEVPYDALVNPGSPAAERAYKEVHDAAVKGRRDAYEARYFRAVERSEIAIRERFEIAIPYVSDDAEEHADPANVAFLNSYIASHVGVHRRIVLRRRFKDEKKRPPEGIHRAAALGGIRL